MGSFYKDYKNQSNSTPSIAGTTAMATAITGTAVDLAGKYGAMVLWTFGTPSATVGTGSMKPWIHESADNVTFGTASAAAVQSNVHGSLVGSTSATLQGLSYLMGYSGKKRFVRAFLDAGGVTQAGTAVGGTSGMNVSATIISFAAGNVPRTGN